MDNSTDALFKLNSKLRRVNTEYQNSVGNDHIYLEGLMYGLETAIRFLNDKEETD
jgi:hypothetical protein